MLAVKDRLVGDKPKAISSDLLVKLTWSLTALEGTQVSNPILPKLIERLATFQRDTPLSGKELIQVYQIQVYIDDMIARKQLPAEFSKVIPQAVREAAELEFERHDRQILYPNVQREIAKKLLKLRVSFQENVPAADETAYFVDFKLTQNYRGTVLVLSGDRNTNTSTGELLGTVGVKTRFLASREDARELHVHLIDVAEWESWGEQQKLEHLYSLSRVEGKKMMA